MRRYRWRFDARPLTAARGGSTKECPMSDEKTEQPTEQRLRDARKEGQVSKSTDLTDAITMSATIAVLTAAAGRFADAFRALIDTALGFVNADHSLSALTARLFKLGTQALAVIIPCVAASAIAAIAALFPQVGFQISTKPVTPNPLAVNPMSGLQRIFSLRSVTELIKTLIKVAIVGCVMWVTIRMLLPLVAGSLYQPLPDLSKMFWDILTKLFMVAAVVFIAIGAIDVMLQRMMFMRRMRMSKQEVVREHKQQEGDPTIKSERRRLAREWINEPPRPRVGLANALIVNPTHYAVAIRYAPDEYPLPLVIAKGQDEQAAQLRLYAQEERVPIVGNPPVARALYKVGIDEPIPEELFETVAAILRWIDAIGAKERTSAQPSAAHAPH